MDTIATYSALVVNSSDQLLQYFSKNITDHTLDLTFCENFKEAIALIRKELPNIIIVHHSEESNGLEITKKIRMISEKVSIIIILDENDPLLLTKATNAGVDFVLQNGFDDREIQLALNRCYKKIRTTENEDVENYQNIISFDHAGHMVVMCNRETFLGSNKTFRNFFGLKSQGKLKEMYHSFGERFVNSSGCLKSESGNWLDTILQAPKKNRKIAFENTKGETRRMIVNFSALTQPEDLYVLTFTDITELEKGTRVLLNGNGSQKVQSWKEVFTQVSKELHRYKRHHVNFGIAMVGLTDFYDIPLKDDYNGQQIIEELMQTTTRPTDTFIKAGVSDYLILLSHTDQNGCNHFLERFMKILCSNEVVQNYNYNYKLSCVTYIKGQDTVVTLLKRLETLYRSTKKKKGNQIQYTYQQTGADKSA